MLFRLLSSSLQLLLSEGQALCVSPQQKEALRRPRLLELRATARSRQGSPQDVQGQSQHNGHIKYYIIT